MPALAKLLETYAAQRDRFEIFAFHNGSVETLEELDEKLEEIVEDSWGGEPPPIPILLDTTGETYRNFAVRSLGTCVLIDPAGNVVRGKGEEVLEQALAALGEAPAATPKAREVTGRVTDASGGPAPGIEVSTYWTWKDGRWSARDGVRTDSEGNFNLSVRRTRRARSLMALDDAQELGAVALLNEEAGTAPVALRLQVATRVHGGFDSESLGQPPEKMYVSITAKPALIAVASYVGPPDFSVKLPSADYYLRVKGEDCQRVTKRITLTPDMRAVDLGTTDLEATIIAQYYGRAPPPLHVTDARGIDREIRLSDLRGKWVLLEFWGWW